MQNPVIDPILIHEIRRNDFLDKIKGPEVFLYFATQIERTLIFKAKYNPVKLYILFDNKIKNN